MSAISAGERLFARYAYPPNELGYCGPAGSDELLVSANSGAGDVRSRAMRFDGAWIYLKIIADAVGIGDPLDLRVVEAYWVGNELLRHVDPDHFGRAIRTTLASEIGADWRTLQLRNPAAVPHHSFQVFAVYPWVALLGRGDTPRHVLDRCRIRTGIVQSVTEEFLDVEYRPLAWNGRQLVLDGPTTERVRWSTRGLALSDIPRRGQFVALHWDWVCDRLTDEQVTACDEFTERQLALTNAVIARG